MKNAAGSSTVALRGLSSIFTCRVCFKKSVFSRILARFPFDTAENAPSEHFDDFRDLHEMVVTTSRANNVKEVRPNIGPSDPGPWDAWDRGKDESPDEDRVEKDEEEA